MTDDTEMMTVEEIDALLAKFPEWQRQGIGVTKTPIPRDTAEIALQMARRAATEIPRLEEAAFDMNEHLNREIDKAYRLACRVGEYHEQAERMREALTQATEIIERFAPDDALGKSDEGQPYKPAYVDGFRQAIASLPDTDTSFADKIKGEVLRELIDRAAGWSDNSPRQFLKHVASEDNIQIPEDE